MTSSAGTLSHGGSATDLAGKDADGDVFFAQTQCDAGFVMYRRGGEVNGEFQKSGIGLLTLV